jgi:uncharacterized protein (TIGR00369 family)
MEGLGSGGVTGSIQSDSWAAGLDIRPVEGGWVMPLSGRHMNFLDGAHGGALFSLAEVAMRERAAEDGPDPVLLDAHLALTAGGSEGDVFTARTEPVKVGRTLGVYRTTVTRGDGKVVGEFTGTVRFAE